MVVPMSPAALTSSSSLCAARPGRNSSGAKRASAGAAHDAAGEADGIGGDAPILVLREIIGADRRGGAGSALCACTLPRLAGRRLQTLSVIAGNACKGSPNRSSDSGCDVKFEVGGRIVRRGFGEQAELRGRHGHRPASRQGILHPHPGTFGVRLKIHIERAGIRYFKNGAQLQMVLQVLADPGQFVQSPACRCSPARPAARCRKVRADAACRSRRPTE